jgi:hypothetical protein
MSETTPPITEEQAVMAVLRGMHPQNCLVSNEPTVMKTPQSVYRFVRSIPQDWVAFRKVIDHWLYTNGYPQPDAFKIFSVTSKVDRDEPLVVRFFPKGSGVVGIDILGVEAEVYVADVELALEAAKKTAP